jgi:cytidylate kinase
LEQEHEPAKENKKIKMLNVATISRQYGSGGSYIAVDVARATGLKYIDREIIDRAAREVGVSETALDHMEDAEKRVMQSDESLTSYLRRYYKVNWLDSDIYDLVINTGKIARTQAVEVIVAVMHGHL